VIVAGVDVAAAYCFIRCGGTTPKGEDVPGSGARNLLLRRIEGSWKVFHQHVSKTAAEFRQVAAFTLSGR